MGVSSGLLGRFLGALGVIFAPTRPPRDPRGPQEPPKTNELEQKLGSLALRGLPGRLIFLPQIDQNRPKIDVKKHSKIASFLKSISDGILVDLGSILSQFWIKFRSMLAIILKSVEIQKTMKNRPFLIDLKGFGSWIPKVFFEFSEVRSKTPF